VFACAAARHSEMRQALSSVYVKVRNYYSQQEALSIVFLGWQQVLVEYKSIREKD
jgi:hypothetical protein